jgi:hypothetical protein
LVGLGKDAAVTASTDMDRPSSGDTLPVKATAAQARDDTHHRDLAPALSYQLRRLWSKTQRSHDVRMDWRSRHPTWGRSTGLSFLTPRRNSCGAEGWSAGGAPTGGRQSREGPVYFLPRALSPKRPPESGGYTVQARSSPEWDHFPPVSEARSPCGTLGRDPTPGH